ncbi:hypothetical protein CCP3SC15_730016 [Gammaproteobacteria bacterium]
MQQSYDLLVMTTVIRLRVRLPDIQPLDTRYAGPAQSPTEFNADGSYRRYR